MIGKLYGQGITHGRKTEGQNHTGDEESRPTEKSRNLCPRQHGRQGAASKSGSAVSGLTRHVSNRNDWLLRDIYMGNMSTEAQSRLLTANTGTDSGCLPLTPGCNSVTRAGKRTWSVPWTATSWQQANFGGSINEIISRFEFICSSAYHWRIVAYRALAALPRSCL